MLIIINSCRSGWELKKSWLIMVKEQDNGDIMMAQALILVLFGIERDSLIIGSSKEAVITSIQKSKYCTDLTRDGHIIIKPSFRATSCCV